MQNKKNIFHNPGQPKFFFTCSGNIKFTFCGADPPLRGSKTSFQSKQKKGLLETTLETCCTHWITFCQSDTP